MKCMYCQGKMRKTQAPFYIDRKGYYLSLEAVPAWVCGQCGEPYFEEHEVKNNSAPAPSVGQADRESSLGGVEQSPAFRASAAWRRCEPR
jgi:YgiT-type zinc finger domain-containing protein